MRVTLCQPPIFVYCCLISFIINFFTYLLLEGLVGADGRLLPCRPPPPPLPPHPFRHPLCTLPTFRNFLSCNFSPTVAFSHLIFRYVPWFPREFHKSLFSFHGLVSTLVLDFLVSINPAKRTSWSKSSHTLWPEIFPCLPLHAFLLSAARSVIVWLSLRNTQIESHELCPNHDLSGSTSKECWRAARKACGLAFFLPWFSLYHLSEIFIQFCPCRDISRHHHRHMPKHFHVMLAAFEDFSILHHLYWVQRDPYMMSFNSILRSFVNIPNHTNPVRRHTPPPRTNNKMTYTSNNRHNR